MAKSGSKGETAKYVATIFGALPLLLGATVLTGWYTGNKLLIQVSPTFVPMQYNTALGFLLCGLGLLLALYWRDIGGVVCGWLSAIIGLATLSEYGFQIDIGLDQLFMEHYVTTATSHPGRMAPNTALSFSVVGLALVAVTRDTSAQRKTIAIGILGSIALGLGVIAGSGYVIGMETAYGWGKLTKMAVHTAAGFVLLGIGLLAYAWLRTDRGTLALPRWTPYAIIIVVSTITISLWQALNAIDAIGIAQYLVLGFGIVTAIALGGLLYSVQSLRLVAQKQSQDLISEIAERNKAEQEATSAAALLRDAIENLSEGFAVYDSEDRLVICNDKYKSIYSRVADILVPGTSFEELVDEDLKRSEGEQENAAEIKKRLMDQHRECSGEPVVRQARDGRWIQSTDYRTTDGGLVGIRTDVTEFVEAQDTLNEKMEEMEVFNKVAIGREMRMIELKTEINELFTSAGQDPKYEIVE